jgi:hypothetical protein
MNRFHLDISGPRLHQFRLGFHGLVNQQSSKPLAKFDLHHVLIFQVNHLPTTLQRLALLDIFCEALDLELEN